MSPLNDAWATAMADYWLDAAPVDLDAEARAARVLAALPNTPAPKYNPADEQEFAPPPPEYGDARECDAAANNDFAQRMGWNQ